VGVLLRVTLVQKRELGSERLLLLSTSAISVHCSISGTVCTKSWHGHRLSGNEQRVKGHCIVIR